MGPSKKPVIEPQTFVAAVAHELKNPLSAIFGYADLLIETYVGDGLTPKQREVAERIRQTASKAVDLVKNYQFLALHEGKEEVSASADLTAIFSAVYDSYWRDSHRNITVTLQTSSEQLRVIGSASHVERIISNLLSNAMKYTPPKGTVTITSRKVGDRTLFEVHNTGSHIPPEEVAAIFSMYSRGKYAEQHNPGAGLGLYIVHTICAAIKAKLEVKSSEESGTTFSVLFKNQRVP